MGAGGSFMWDKDFHSVTLLPSCKCQNLRSMEPDFTSPHSCGVSEGSVKPLCVVGCYILCSSMREFRMCI
jgi:hypothetical protein